MAIHDYVKTGRATDGRKSPPEVADMIDRFCDSSESWLAQLRSGGNRELGDVLQDIRTIVAMGRYYAAKIRGATEVALHRETSGEEHRRDAVSLLTRAAEHWKTYARLMTSRYRSPVWMNRVGHVDWLKLQREAERDIAIARGE